MTTCYDLLEIKILNERILARPIAWDKEIYDGFGNDINGDPVKATEWHGTCPHCGNLVHFTKNDIYPDINKENNIQCSTCKSGSEAWVAEGQQLPPDVKAFEPNKDIFLDPISNGLFDIEIDMELFNKVESTESN